MDGSQPALDGTAMTADHLSMAVIELRPSRRPRAVVALVALALVLAACNPDPTGGARPPAPGEGPAYGWSVRSATRDDVALSWRSGCPVPWQDLSVVRVAYWGYDGARHVGDLVVHDQVATPVREAFGQIYNARFQIRRIHPVDLYGADDDRSMAENNTSAFNCRTVAGTTAWSQHSYGRAIDINPIQNPYVKGSSVDPPAGRDWVDRSSVTPGMIVADGPVVRAFSNIGWGWGGSWTNSKDYQHLSQNGR